MKLRIGPLTPLNGPQPPDFRPRPPVGPAVWATGPGRLAAAMEGAWVRLTHQRIVCRTVRIGGKP